MSFSWGEVTHAGSAAAAARLLGSQCFDGAGWITLTEAEHGAAFNRLDREQHRSMHTPATEFFSSHEAYEIPDNPPTNIGPRSSRVDRFCLDVVLSRAINAELSTTWQRMAMEDSSQVSNINGGFHSPEETWGHATSSAWYSMLLPAVTAACRTRCSSDHAEFAISGWLNSSSPSSFNCLHDHGDSELSVVYFVRAGSDIPSRDNEHIQAGSLLLRPQLAPFSHQYGYIDIAPRPGELWVFPGHLPHAVLPRVLSPADEGVSEDLSMRISVACNVSLSL